MVSEDVSGDVEKPELQAELYQFDSWTGRVVPHSPAESCWMVMLLPLFQGVLCTWETELSLLHTMARGAGVSPLSHKNHQCCTECCALILVFFKPIFTFPYAQPLQLWSQCSTAKGTWETLLGNRCCKGQLPLPSHWGSKRPSSAPSCLSQDIQGKTRLVLWRQSAEARNYSESRSWKQTAVGKKEAIQGNERETWRETTKGNIK